MILAVLNRNDSRQREEIEQVVADWMRRMFHKTTAPTVVMKAIDERVVGWSDKMESFGVIGNVLRLKIIVCESAKNTNQRDTDLLQEEALQSFLKRRLVNIHFFNPTVSA